jgi:hypothetical protein
MSRSVYEQLFLCSNFLYLFELFYFSRFCIHSVIHSSLSAALTYTEFAAPCQFASCGDTLKSPVTMTLEHFTPISTVCNNMYVPSELIPVTTGNISVTHWLTLRDYIGIPYTVLHLTFICCALLHFKHHKCTAPRMAPSNVGLERLRESPIVLPFSEMALQLHQI